MTLSDLRAVCEKATPGPWETREDGRRSNLLTNYAIDSSVMADSAGDPAQICENMKGKNASFIATFHPARVLEILQDYEAMKAALERIEKGLGGHIDDDQIARECLASLRLGKEGGENE